MSVVTIRVLDTTGSRARAIEARMTRRSSGCWCCWWSAWGCRSTRRMSQLMSYKLHDRRSGRQLLDSETLHDAGIEAGAELRLQAEITAGTAKL